MLVLQVHARAPCKQWCRVQAQIVAFVEEQAAAEADAGSGKRAAPDAATSSKSKVAKVDSALATKPPSGELTQGDGIALTDDGMARCSVRDFKGKTYVNLRTYYMVCLDSGNSCIQACAAAPHCHSLSFWTLTVQ